MNNTKKDHMNNILIYEKNDNSQSYDKAKDNLINDLPPSWKIYKTKSSHTYYYNVETGESLLEHPYYTIHKQQNFDIKTNKEQILREEHDCINDNIVEITKQNDIEEPNKIISQKQTIYQPKSPEISIIHNTSVGPGQRSILSYSNTIENSLLSDLSNSNIVSSSLCGRQSSGHNSLNLNKTVNTGGLSKYIKEENIDILRNDGINEGEEEIGKGDNNNRLEKSLQKMDQNAKYINDISIEDNDDESIVFSDLNIEDFNFKSEEFGRVCDEIDNEYKILFERKKQEYDDLIQNQVNANSQKLKLENAKLTEILSKNLSKNKEYSLKSQSSISPNSNNLSILKEQLKEKIIKEMDNQLDNEKRKLEQLIEPLEDIEGNTIDVFINDLRNTLILDYTKRKKELQDQINDLSSHIKQKLINQKDSDFQVLDEEYQGFEQNKLKILNENTQKLKLLEADEEIKQNMEINSFCKDLQNKLDNEKHRISNENNEYGQYLRDKKSTLLKYYENEFEKTKINMQKTNERIIHEMEILEKSKLDMEIETNLQDVICVSNDKGDCIITEKMIQEEYNKKKLDELVEIYTMKYDNEKRMLINDYKYIINKLKDELNAMSNTQDNQLMQIENLKTNLLEIENSINIKTNLTQNLKGEIYKLSENLINYRNKIEEKQILLDMRRNQSLIKQNLIKNIDELYKKLIEKEKDIDNIKQNNLNDLLSRKFTMSQFYKSTINDCKENNNTNYDKIFKEADMNKKIMKISERINSIDDFDENYKHNNNNNNQHYGKINKLNSMISAITSVDGFKEYEQDEKNNLKESNKITNNHVFTPIFQTKLFNTFNNENTLKDLTIFQMTCDSDESPLLKTRYFMTKNEWKEFIKKEKFYFEKIFKMLKLRKLKIKNHQDELKNEQIHFKMESNQAKQLSPNQLSVRKLTLTIDKKRINEKIKQFNQSLVELRNDEKMIYDKEAILINIECCLANLEKLDKFTENQLLHLYQAYTNIKLDNILNRCDIESMNYLMPNAFQTECSDLGTKESRNLSTYTKCTWNQKLWQVSSSTRGDNPDYFISMDSKDSVNEIPYKRYDDGKYSTMDNMY